MDFGLGKLLEMFEDRFGRRATTLFIALLSLGASCLAVNVIWKTTVQPIAESFDSSFDSDEAVSLLWRLVLSVLAGWFLYAVAWYGFFRKRVEALRKRADAAMEETKKLQAELEALDARVDEANEFLAESQAMLAAEQKKIAEVKKDFNAGVAEARAHVAALVEQGYKVPPELQALANQEPFE